MVKPHDTAKPLTKVALVMLVTVAVLLGSASIALAAPWTDIDGTLLESYGISSDQIAQISTGLPDGSWQPWRNVTRAQFVKMADAAFAIVPANPSSPTFSDVPPTDQFYQYIEGAYLAGLVKGTADGVFDPTATITREQAAAIVARKVAADQGFDLSSMKEEDITVALAGFQDAATVSASLRAEMAYAVGQGLIKGVAADHIYPKNAMSRIAAAALLIRAMGPAPLVLDATDNGSSITLAVGDTVRIVLKGNPTTGFGWAADISGDDAVIVQQVGEPIYVPDAVPAGIVGAGGTYTFTFKALAPGEATLRLIYERSWEDVPPLETFAVTVKVEEQPLEGTAWKLEAWSISSLYPSDFDITAAFEDGRVSGKAAVNTYSGPYTIGANGGFSTGTLIQTLMAGSPAAMQAESAYLGLLQQARLYRLSADRLTLLDANANELLIFVRMVGAGLS
jgi:predicted secreted protein